MSNYLYLLALVAIALLSISSASTTAINPCESILITAELSSKQGLCEAHIPSFFFNKKTNSCEAFIYGGCHGNANRFGTINECNQFVTSLKKCAKLQKMTCVEMKKLANLPPKSGMCMAYFQRFYINKKTKNCEQFVYGGCGGNANRFESAKECEEVVVSLKKCPSLRQ